MKWRFVFFEDQTIKDLDKKNAESLNEYRVDLDSIIPLGVMHDEHMGDV
jgi:hypothetical protein